MRARWVSGLTERAVAGSSIAGIGACSDVTSCTEYDVGCINGVPDDSGNCRAGLVPNADRTACVEKGAAATPPPNNSCGCPTNELCRDDGQCVNVCTTPPNLPPRTEPTKTCRPLGGEAPYDFAKASVALCYQTCIRRSVLCGTACNPTTECGTTAATTLTTTLCPTQMPECAMKLCEQVRDAPCGQQQCPPSSPLNCTGITCKQYLRHGPQVHQRRHLRRRRPLQRRQRGVRLGHRLWRNPAVRAEARRPRSSATSATRASTRCSAVAIAPTWQAPRAGA